MVLKDILAISGEPGLFKFVAQGKNAIIVEHLETGKRSSAFSSAKVSSLEDISVFTENEDLSLGKVFDKIFEKESGGPAIDSKSEAEKLKKYFEEIVPDYSKERVYLSDIKKIILWYNLLHKKELLIKEEPEKTADSDTKESKTDSAPALEKKKKKSTPGTKE
ncbi:MAG: hypothetical protein A2V46_07475 [Bacteroidetes bacterium RBG_19FT_COMBO_42_7]|nr:MAG: hypothetical protein A2Y71_12600 [Bacteroidetes bacterium RBG_13_42_15]OFY77343.1 MAG: hypothetical protein A2V46_07475 [Bacteroidetes bacterium RBG_19FT_COMBO_42_7]